ncbi:hypothetical protein N6H18_15145 [Reichenbachiella agarivorans]|uniref:DUF1648 domain-containing protein n=1 Tax=Reichenbachiella agarivorans TaxID=2979464 RepID=A0ABY6CMS5_9BACT|nr:hypothetical protein [Reichenbachiella agarivorans]UXP31684.1 hypothetical protein N6H18_15145 [Reichenbachiella agarivorans]
MVKAIRFCYLISIPIFLAVLSYYYALMPETVSVYFDANGLATYTVAKGNFFYACIGIFALTNGLIMLYRRLTKHAVDMSLIDFSEMNKTESNYHWFGGLSLMFNVCYILSIVFIGLYHSKEKFDITDYAALVYLGPIFIILWIFWFIYLQFTKK